MEQQDAPYSLPEYREWILEQQDSRYDLQESDGKIYLKTSYAEAVLTPYEDLSIMEFLITDLRTSKVGFYLHFEVREEAHAKKMFHDLVSSLKRMEQSQPIRVLLSCTSGLTTGFFVQQLNAAASSQGLDMSFEAVPYDHLYESGFRYDVILLAPQIGYLQKEVQAILQDEIVLTIPTAIFASYDASALIMEIRDRLSSPEAEPQQEPEHPSMLSYEDTILTILFQVQRGGILRRQSAPIRYRVKERGSTVLDDMVIKDWEDLCLEDIENIIETCLRRCPKISAIALSLPFAYYNKGRSLQEYLSVSFDLPHYLEERYHCRILISTHAKMAAGGISLLHPEYHSLCVYCRPFGYDYGSFGAILNGDLIGASKPFAGDLAMIQHSLGGRIGQIFHTPAGARKAVAEDLIEINCTLAPQIIFLRSDMTPDADDIRAVLSQSMPESCLPELQCMHDLSEEIFLGMEAGCLSLLSGSAKI
jgi:cellobiose-specific phosphotransferase system component IIB